MVTISFQQILTVVLINAIGFTHGPDGVSSIPRPAGFASGQAFLARLLSARSRFPGYLVWCLTDTRLGRAMRAVRDNGKLAASASGIDVFRTKVIAFALAALLGGLGVRGLFAGGFSYISPDQFAFSDSIVLLTMSLLGGVSSPIGSAIGTGLLILIPEWLRFLKSVPGLYLAVYGLAVILIVVFMPDGIWGYVSGLFRTRERPPSKVTEPLTLRPVDSGAPIALELRGLCKNFGGLKAVDGVDLQVRRRGGVHALIGPNGSGHETTTLQRHHRALSRDGRRHFRRRRGCDRTVRSQTHDRWPRTHFPEHSSVPVDDRARKCRGWRRARRQCNRRWRTGRASATLRPRRARLRRVGEHRTSDTIPSFSYGHQRLIEIARCVGRQSHGVVAADEPAAGLNMTGEESAKGFARPHRCPRPPRFCLLITT